MPMPPGPSIRVTEEFDAFGRFQPGSGGANKRSGGRAPGGTGRAERARRST